MAPEEEEEFYHTYCTHLARAYKELHLAVNMDPDDTDRAVWTAYSVIKEVIKDEGIDPWVNEFKIDPVKEDYKLKI